MYPRKSLTLAITAGLMFGIGACSMQEKSQTKKEGHTVKDDRAAVSEHDEGRQDPLSARHRIAGDVECGAILHRLARIDKFSLAENVAAGCLACTPKLNQWRIADGIDDVFTEVHEVYFTGSLWNLGNLT